MTDILIGSALLALLILFCVHIFIDVLQLCRDQVDAAFLEDLWDDGPEPGWAAETREQIDRLPEFVA